MKVKDEGTIAVKKKGFTRRLLKWNSESNTRQMPWKGEKDPYLIWLSEIILQQTRVEQGLPYFLSFKSKYPSVKHLALAQEDEVMRLWQGLGYYSRARNLHYTAKHVHSVLKGAFPASFAELKKLKGIGDYTAAAIASFAFGEPKAVVDGNVIRVLSRVFGISTPFDTTQGKKQFAALANELVDAAQPAAYNQAIMDFGSTVCTPQNPNCKACPLSELCVAKATNTIDDLPVRAKKIKIGKRYFNYLVIRQKDSLWIEKRTKNDIWKNLYQLPLIETGALLKRDFHNAVAKFLGDKDFTILSYSEDYKQQLTHLKIHARFIEIKLRRPNTNPPPGWTKVKTGDLNKLAFPKVVHLYLTQNSLL